MNHPNAITASRHKKLVPDDKFDRHMTRARENDTDSRKTIFDQQTADGISFECSGNALVSVEKYDLLG